MFTHIFKYTFVDKIRTKAMIFWMIIFPIILATLFSFAFSNMLAGEEFEIIDIAIIENDSFKENIAFKGTIESISNEKSEDKIFNVTYADTENAKKLLEEEKIAGYIEVNGKDIDFITVKSEIEQTIIKGFLDDYLQTSSTIENIINSNPSSLSTGLIDDISTRNEYIEDINYSSKDPNNTVIYFYTIIGMICMYASFFGISNINAIQANCSTLACRNAIAPTSKFKYFIAATLASIAVQLILLAILFLYMIFILNVDFGTNILYIIITSVIGSICGILFGTLLGAILKVAEDKKVAICVSVTMLFCSLSGMMGAEMKYYIDTAVPMLKYINPVRIITDALYTIYYYTDYTRLYLNWALIGGISLIFLIVTVIILRRQKYASI